MLKVAPFILMLILKKPFVDHFTDIYTDNEEEHWMISNLNWRKISNQSSSMLVKPFNEHEVFTCLKMMGNDKTLGPDGFTMEFFKKVWNIFKADIMNLFQDFFPKRIINKSLNATYIALIPKKQSPQMVTNYRPISLTSSVYKILAKVLAGRLKYTLPETISQNQYAFVKGMQIIDPILIANEIADYWRYSKQKDFIIKLDVEKAFDKLNWDFLLSMFKQKGYNEKWIS